MSNPHGHQHGKNNDEDNNDIDNGEGEDDGMRQDSNPRIDNDYNDNNSDNNSDRNDEANDNLVIVHQPHRHHHRRHHRHYQNSPQNGSRVTPTPANQIQGEDCYHDNNGYSTIPPVTSRPRYSPNKVRVVLPLIATLSSAGWAIGSVVDQYLLHRWQEEAGYRWRRMDGLNDSVGVPSGGLCSRNESDPWVIEGDRIEQRVSTAIMYLSITTCLPAFLTCLIAGAVVDTVGRRPPLVLALMGTTCQLIVAMVIMGFHLDPDFLYLAYALDGLGGSYFALLIASFSVTADVSDNKNKRILGIAILTVLGALAYAIINVIIGLLIKNIGFIAGATAILIPLASSLLVAAVFLPETLPMPRQEVTCRRLWDYGTRIVFLYTRHGDERTRKCLFICLMIFFTAILNFVNTSNTDVLYQSHAPLCWNAAQLGYYTAFRHAGTYTAALIYLCLFRYLGCMSDEYLAMLGMLFLAGSYVLEAFVTTTWQMYLVPVLMIPGVNIAHITRGVMSVLAGPENQGVMFSSVALFEVGCSLTAFTAYNKIYDVTVTFMPGFVYLVMACVSLITFSLFVPFLYYYERPSSKRYAKLIQERTDSLASPSTSVTSSTTSSATSSDREHP